MTKRINPDILEEYKSKNTDPYGATCVTVAEEVMNKLDTFEGEFNIGYSPDMTTPHGIICQADRDTHAGGITGFMAGAARSIVAQCHELGWKFYLADTISKYDIGDPDRLEDAVDRVANNDLFDVPREEVVLYVRGLVDRYIARKIMEEGFE